MPGGRISQVRIDVKYGESVKGDVLYNFQGQFGVTIDVEEEDAPNWKKSSGKSFKKTYKWLNGVIKKSIDEAAKEMGVKIEDEDDGED